MITKQLFDGYSKIEIISYIIQELDENIDYDDNLVPDFEDNIIKMDTCIHSEMNIHQWKAFQNAYFDGRHCGDCISYPMSCIACIYGDYLSVTNKLIPRMLVGDKQSLKNTITYNVLCNNEDEFFRCHVSEEKMYNIFAEKFLEYLGYFLRKNDINFEFLNNNFNKYD